LVVEETDQGEDP